MKLNDKKYKAFINNKWIYGDIKIDYDDNFNKHYYLVNKKEQYEVNTNNICKITKFKDENNNFLYTNDIINVKTDETDLILILSIYNGLLEIDSNVEVYLYGLTLMDFNNKPFLPGYKLLSNNESIQYVGNIIENNIKFNIKGEKENG